METEKIVRKLEGARVTANGWQAPCPAHDDRKASLSVGEDGGKTLFYCHALCETPKIVQALGLQMKDLFPSASQQSEVVATYNYRDENGNILFQTVRYNPKDFKARRPDGDGGWVYSLENVRLVPYRLPDIKKYDEVVVTEGEKDARTGFLQLGLQTTTNPFGAGKWREEYSPHFAGKTVILCPHNDDAGRKHMRAVASSLFPVAKKVIIVELPFGKDLTEWYALGGTRKQLSRLATAAPAVTAEQVQSWKTSEAQDAGLRMKSLQELMSEPKKAVRWTVEALLPAGGTSLLVAKPKVGKSTTSRCLAFAVARGRKFLGRRTQNGPVLYLAPQEMESEVAAHFKKLGATRSEPIHVSCEAPDFTVSKLEKLIREYSPVLVILDQVLHFIHIKDENKYAEVTKALQPIEALARRFPTLHILMTYHAGKSTKADAGDAPLGSTAFFGAVDTLLTQKRSASGTYRTLESRQRYKDARGDLAETLLEFDIARGSISLGVPKDGYEVERIQNAIMQFLRKNQNERFEEETVLSYVKGEQAFKRKALRKLYGDERISRKGRGVKGDPFLYSAL